MYYGEFDYLPEYKWIIIVLYSLCLHLIVVTGPASTRAHRRK
jgi:hypothetical protein